MTLQKHDREVHPNESQELVCHVCGFSTMRKRLMSVHFARKHDPEKQKKCPHCDFQTGKAGCEEFREPTKIGHSFRK